MADFDRMKQLFDKLGVDHDVQSLSSGDATELAASYKEPAVGKSKKYILIGNVSFHFDHFGRFLGVESTTFEPRQQEDEDVEASTDNQLGESGSS
jgi:hypothetical protein